MGYDPKEPRDKLGKWTGAASGHNAGKGNRETAKNISESFYHWTDKKNISSIKKQGLLPKPDEYAKPEAQGPGVNFVKAPNTDVGIVLEKNDRLLKISSKNFDMSKVVDHGNGWVRYMGHVPAKNIKKFK